MQEAIYVPQTPRGSFDLCPWCGQSEYRDLRLNIDTFDEICSLPPEADLTRRQLQEVYCPRAYHKTDWRRASYLHSSVCKLEAMQSARRIGNRLVTNALDDLISSAWTELPLGNRSMPICISDYIFNALREAELETYYGTKSTDSLTYGLVEMCREENKSIL